MAGGVTEPWDAEPIPDNDFLLFRVHRGVMKTRDLPEPGAFRNQPTKQDGMSTNWNRYADAAWTRENYARKPIEEYAVIRMSVQFIKTIPDQRVEHTPICDHVNNIYNRAHADVFGRKDTETRVHYLRAMETGDFETVIPLPVDP